MFKYVVKKNPQYKSKSFSENIVRRELNTLRIDTRRVVDINRLLNRVKLDKKQEVKKQIIFFSSVILMLSFIGTFITIIK